MDDTTLKALEASIEHWKRNAEAMTIAEASVHADFCALCTTFCREGTKDCQDCPVMEKTGESYCRVTPYPLAHAAYSHWLRATHDYPLSSDPVLNAREDFWASAQEEVNFLKSLLPTHKE